MKIKSFYRQNRCEQSASFDNMFFEENRHSILNKAVDMACSVMSTQPVESIVKNIGHYLKTEYEKTGIENVPWQGELYVYDSMLLKRMVTFLQKRYTIVKVFQETSMEVPVCLLDNSHVLEGKVHLILQDAEGNYHAVIIHSGKCRRSLKGKSANTASAMDLHCLVAKYCLEREYPNITIHPLYLTHQKDTSTAILQELEVSDYRTSNFQSLSYSDFYSEEVFDYEMLRDVIVNVVSEKTSVNCFDCNWANLCKTPLLEKTDEEMKTDASKDASQTEHTYQMPTFTQAQLEVVHHVDGPMLVCAGPGSGKTATLIGRIRHLIEECHVPAQFILVVTFTKKAAEELRERCLSFLEEEDLPCISTLNAFCYKVLRENQDLLEMDLKILDSSEKVKIIKNLVSVLPNIDGFSYDKKEGEYGLYKTISNRIDNFLKMGEVEFFNKYPDVGQTFVTLVTMYQDIIESSGYITFDQQISLCNLLFTNYPDVLEQYSSVYQYVMVDEFQDVNEEQFSMVYSLASHGNVVVVGDDDQCIYEFRGASSEHMLHFSKYYPSTKTVVLTDNFRSTKTLVDVAQKLIHNNQKRIAKDIRSGSGKEGVLPQVIPSLETSSIDTVIEQLVSEGYDYGQIAVLSTKNAPLEDIHKELKAPSVLAKSFLRNDGLFLFIYTVIQLYMSDMQNDKAFYQYAKLFGKSHLLRKVSGKSVYDATIEHYGIPDFRSLTEVSISEVSNHELCHALSLLADMYDLLKEDPGVSLLIDCCNYKLQWTHSDCRDVLLEQIENQSISTIRDFAVYLEQLVTFDSEIKVEVDCGNRVSLMTCHDAKGKEFPVVIIRNDYSDLTEDVRRVFYVAVTRAKERLFIMQDDSCKTNLLSEIPHVTAS